MKLEIVTPIRRMGEVEATEVVIPGEAGEFGILPGHKPFLAALGTGALSYKSGGKNVALMVSGGLAEVLEGRVLLLAEYMQPADEIDLSEAKRTLEEIERQLKSLPPDGEDTKSLTARLDRWQARISVGSSR
jgi:F-type H+-transporting ATPase subunit epsilon